MKLIISCIICLVPFFLDAQIITTFAGNGLSGYTGENILATTEAINYPSGMVVDRNGFFYFAERLNNRVRKVSPDGIISTFAGNGVAGFSGDGLAATTAKLNAPTGIAIDTSGNIYIADHDNNRVRKVNSQTGIITTVAGNGGTTSSGDGGPATSASFAFAVNVHVSKSGELFVVDDAPKIRKVSITGVITTVAGNGTFGYGGDDGPATNAQLRPTDVTTDATGNIYIADYGNGRIRKVTRSTGTITTIAGTGTGLFNGDNLPCLNANIGPFCLAIDKYENLFFGDWFNNRIRKIDFAGIVTTIAGNGIAGYNGNTGPATSIQIYGPEGIALDSCGDIYISDCQNKRIRKITYPKCHYLETENLPQVSSQISIYPNPSNDILHIDNLQTTADYRLLSMVGAVLQQGGLK